MEVGKSIIAIQTDVKNRPQSPTGRKGMTLLCIPPYPVPPSPLPSKYGMIEEGQGVDAVLRGGRKSKREAAPKLHRNFMVWGYRQRDLRAMKAAPNL